MHKPRLGCLLSRNKLCKLYCRACLARLCDFRCCEEMSLTIYSLVFRLPRLWKYLKEAAEVSLALD